MPERWKHAMEDLGHGLEEKWEETKTRAKNWKLKRGAKKVAHPEDSSIGPENRLSGWRRRNSLDRMLWKGGPRFEVSESPGEIVVQASLPGLKKDEFAIEIEGRFLTIRAEQKGEEEKSGRGYHYYSQSYGAFSRTIPLPSEVDSADAKASYRRGQLTIRLPKTGNPDARRIEIETST